MNNKKRKRLSSIVALGGITLALIIIFAAQKAGSQKGGIIGVGVFVAACIATVILDTKSSGKPKIGKRLPFASKYDPLLLDERTKQDPDVQRLLQYPAVQKAFFDPNYLSTAEAQSDPNVRELLEVFDKMLLNRDPYPNQGAIDASSPYARELFQNDPSRLQKKTRKPRHVIGTLLGLVGVATLIIPFVVVFFTAATDSPDSASNMSSMLFTAAPIGFVLIIVGSIIGRH